MSKETGEAQLAKLVMGNLLPRAMRFSRGLPRPGGVESSGDLPRQDLVSPLTEQPDKATVSTNVAGSRILTVVSVCDVVSFVDKALELKPKLSLGVLGSRYCGEYVIDPPDLVEPD